MSFGAMKASAVLLLAWTGLTALSSPLQAQAMDLGVNPLGFHFLADPQAFENLQDIGGGHAAARRIINVNRLCGERGAFE